MAIFTMYETVSNCTAGMELKSSEQDDCEAQVVAGEDEHSTKVTSAILTFLAQPNMDLHAAIV